MRIEYLNEFITLVKTGNYSVCADELYISQPSLTRHIQELERELNVPLFQRTSKGVTLSEPGRIFMPYAEQILSLQRDYTGSIQEYIHRMNGSLNVSSLFAMKEYGIGSLFQKWHRTFPEISLHIREADSTDIISWLREGKTDFAFVREDFPENNRDFDRIHITEDDMICAVPENSSLSRRKTVTIAELRKERFVYYEQCALTRNLFLGAGFNPEQELTGARGRNALEQVKMGLGIMLEFRRQIGDKELGGFSILEIEPKICSPVNLLYRSVDLSESGKKFVRFIKEQAEE